MLVFISTAQCLSLTCFTTRVVFTCDNSENPDCTNQYHPHHPPFSTTYLTDNIFAERYFFVITNCVYMQFGLTMCRHCVRVQFACKKQKICKKYICEPKFHAKYTIHSSKNCSDQNVLPKVGFFQVFCFIILVIKMFWCCQNVMQNTSCTLPKIVVIKMCWCCQKWCFFQVFCFIISQ